VYRSEWRQIHTISRKKAAPSPYGWCINSQDDWPITQISRARHYSTLSNSQTVRDRYRPLTPSDIWPIELCRYQWPWVTFEAHFRYLGLNGFIVVYQSHNITMIGRIYVTIMSYSTVRTVTLQDADRVRPVSDS